MTDPRCSDELGNMVDYFQDRSASWANELTMMLRSVTLTCLALEKRIEALEASEGGNE